MNSIPLKRCAKCRQNKPLTDFCINRGSPDGRNYYCKTCTYLAQRAQRDAIKAAKPVSELLPDGYKQCYKCKQIKPATSENFWINRDRRDGLNSRCILCCLHPKPIVQVSPGYKRCCKCKQEKPATLEFFNRMSKARDGLQGYCRNCVGQTKPRRPICDIPGYKACLICREIFPATLEYFPSASWVSSGLAPDCKACYRVKSINSRINRRAREKDIQGSHTLEQIEEQLKRQHYHCYYAACGFSEFKKVKGKYVYAIDHTFPLSRVVGTDIPANDISYLVLACPSCNHKKYNRFPHEWFEGGRLL